MVACGILRPLGSKRLGVSTSSHLYRVQSRCRRACWVSGGLALVQRWLAQGVRGGLKPASTKLLVLNAVHCQELVDMRVFGEFQANYWAKVDYLTVMQKNYIVGDAAH